MPASRTYGGLRWCLPAPPRPQLLVALVALLLCGSVSAAGADTVYQDGAFEFAIGPVPAWVKPAPAYPAADASRPVPGGVAILVSDQQFQWDPEPAFFRRIVATPIDASGLQQISHLQIEYNPSFNHLTLHEVAVFRNGTRLNRLEAKNVRLLQRERDLERAKYDGTVTATLVLDDVQMGDLIDYAYTIDGVNPLLPKAASGGLSAGGLVPMGFTRARIVADARRRIQVKPLATTATMTRTETQGTQEWLWEGQNVPAVDLVRDAPGRIAQVPVFVFSEFGSWQQVVEWGMALFPVSNDLSPDLRQRIADWTARETDPSHRALAALRYVQDDIRYFGIELGKGSLTPRDPNETARSGFGDCKDKSLLLIALLRQMGIDAAPALAAQRSGELLGELLPSARVFDHMIVGVRIGGDRFWLDPTMSLQGGDLRASSIHLYGYLLPIEPGTIDLVKLDPADGPANAVERVETFVLPGWDKPAMLTVATTYHGAFANLVRGARAQAKQETIDRQHLSEVQRRYKQATQSRSVEVVDDRANNEVRTVSEYSVPGLIEKADNKTGVFIVASGVLHVVTKSTSRTRRLPYAVLHPVEERHRTVINFPADIKTAPVETHRVRDKAFVFDSRLETVGRRLTFDATWKTQRDAVEAADWPEYLAKNEEMQRYMVAFYDPEPPERAGFLGRLFGNDNYVHDHREKREAIEKLSKVILSGHLSGDALADAYDQRGVQYSNLNLLDEAMFDLNKSLALRPNDTVTLVDRGLVLTSLHRYDDALHDLGRAIELDPANGRYRQLRGITNFHAGRFDAAAEDFRAAVETIGPGEGSYPLLWLYLATLRSGGDTSDLLQRYSKAVDSSAWPYPLVHYYAGDIQLAAVLSAVATGDAKTKLFNTCEADYFIGALALARGDSATAREYFEKARATDVREYLEWIAAGIELERMK
ncbi:MAG TPA: DUF3857 domain-containing protein [Casimicrobiaceae bacterium]|jgi:lipoprotein NlpI/transglutaminase-like putative cysteine protease|nr:DUF3857 domain-containing protein [Casimicrobiaceae bacterium]